MFAAFFEFIGELFGWTVDVTKKWVKRSLFGMVLGVFLAFSSVGTEVGRYLVPTGATLALGSFVLFLIATLHIRMLAEKAAQKMPLFASNLQLIGSVLLMGCFVVVAMIFGETWRHPVLLQVSFVLLGLLALTLALSGASVSLKTLNFRLGLGFLMWSAATIYYQVPADLKTSFTHQIQLKMGVLTPQEIRYTLTSLRQGDPPMFQSVPDARGNPIPRVWFYYDSEEDTYHLYDRPGLYWRDGKSFQVADTTTAKTIVDHLVRKMTADEQAQKARAAAQEQRDIEEEKKKTEEKRPEEVQAPVLKSRSFSGTLPSILESRAAKPILVKGRVLSPQRDFLIAELLEPVSYGYRLFPVNTRMRLDFKNIQYEQSGREERLIIGGYLPSNFSIGDRLFPIGHIAHMVEIRLPEADRWSKFVLSIKGRKIDGDKLTGSTFSFILPPGP